MTTTTFSTVHDPKPAGTIAMFIGGGGGLIAAFALFIAIVQRIIFSTLPAGEGPEGPDLALNATWLIHMPLWVAGGASLAWWGNALRKGREEAARFVRLICWAAVAGVLAYSVHATIAVIEWMRTGHPVGAKLPDVAWPVLFVFGSVAGMASALPMLAPFAVLLSKVPRR